jgi:A/G-specific adenine glycosylase
VPAALARSLLAWGGAARRDLPWRRTRDPWAILVSELMLQQTQVARVAERWPDFLEAFPTPSACAAAPAGDVVRRWSGLGYNRRALYLHRAAQAITADHGGQMPRGLGDLLALPGVGPYTARAVLAFAFEADVGVVDTNAARVLARAVAGRPLRAKEAQDLADQMVPAGRGWEWNQAVLDLGATVCVARAPGCERCPLLDCCVWARRGHPDPDPSVGSAGTTARQSAFEGSDRQGRGRLVDALRGGPVILVDRSAVALACGWPEDPERAARVADGLVLDGLAVVSGDRLRLPG